MSIVRSVLALILVLVTTLLVSCSSGNNDSTPNIYAPEQIEELQKFVVPVREFRTRFEKLETTIDEENWVDTSSLIHGPLGDLRRQLRYLGDNLLPREQKIVKQLSKDLFTDIERLDAAAEAQDYEDAVEEYNRAIRDFDSLLDVVPTAEDNT